MADAPLGPPQSVESLKGERDELLRWLQLMLVFDVESPVPGISAARTARLLVDWLADRRPLTEEQRQLWPSLAAGYFAGGYPNRA
jgi:hypothetical protein